MKKLEQALINRFKNNNKLRRRVNPFRSGMKTSHNIINKESYFDSFFMKLTHQNLDTLLDNLGE